MNSHIFRRHSQQNARCFICLASEFLLTLNEIHPSLSFTMELEDNGKLPFLGMPVIIRNGPRLDTVYVKPTDTGLLLHYQSHVDVKYKHSLLKLNCASKLSSNWQFFHQECVRLKMVFARLHYPETLIENTIRNFIEMRVTENACSKQQVSDEQDAPIRIALSFKDQKSANAVRNQLSDLSRKINAVVQPVYVSKKIKRHFKPKEHKPPIVNEQNVVYYYKCGLCDTDYVGFTSRHLHQRVQEHKRSTIGHHVKDEHRGDPDSIGNNFEILKKCQSKLDCLSFEMFYSQTQTKTEQTGCSIRAKLFT